MSDTSLDPIHSQHGEHAKRRDFLTLTAAAMAAAGGAAVIWPLIDSMNPSKEVGYQSKTEINLALIRLGQRVTIKWRGQPIFVDHRTPRQIAQAEATPLDGLKDPEADSARVKQKEWLVVVGICTHLGCVPLGQNGRDPRGNWGGWFCPCHGSHYDTSGRVRKGPAPRNLKVPPYSIDENSILSVG